MNEEENHARNGVTDCPESRNEENHKDIMLWDSSRYAKVVLRFLRVDNQGLLETKNLIFGWGNLRFECRDNVRLGKSSF
ncbi:hypothetical protein E3N88_46208 [Mikania micrantha]|uniref:Uncharacterized protein n=1 Tax=Mikania micrantha TaxID=192012 RepID=A0A5N6L778_9ASTR|nr:hypothetical protein E3N88_46208 [Mikania micrantha]